jgi:hypothetical protein
MATLLRDPRIHEYDILAIQEPWRNPYTATTHHPAKDIFHLCYLAARGEEGRARVCFFVNKRIDHRRWRFREHSKDVCSLIIEPSADHQDQQSVTVHNIYNVVGGSSPTHSPQQASTKQVLALFACLTQTKQTKQDFFRKGSSNKQTKQKRITCLVCLGCLFI